MEKIMNEIPMKVSMACTSTFRLSAHDKWMEKELRKHGVDLSEMHRTIIQSTYCQITGNDNTWGEE
jgi:hypothetical protein